MVERRAFERRAKREIKKMNAGASAIQGKKLSGERKANLEKMSECPALLKIPAQLIIPCKPEEKYTDRWNGPTFDLTYRGYEEGDPAHHDEHG